MLPIPANLMLRNEVLSLCTGPTVPDNMAADNVTEFLTAI
jgi:hypothetical protein